MIDATLTKIVNLIDRKQLADAVMLVIYDDQYSALTKEKLKPILNLVQHDCVVCVLSPGTKLDVLDETMMEKAGWVRKAVEKKALPGAKPTNAPRQNAPAGTLI